MKPREELLYLRVADRLTQAMDAGTLRRGERLPSVRELSRQHGVSLSTAVQAYRALEDAGRVEARPRSGFFVAGRPRGCTLDEPGLTQPPVDPLAVDISSMVESVLRLAHEPGYLSFGAACPTGELFDQERIRRAVSRAATRGRATLTDYPLGPGDESLRRAIARHALHQGCTLDARQIVITNSCLEAITLGLRTVTKPGDIVALESPTHFGFLQILESLHLRALEIPTHPRTGLSLDALQLALDTQPVRAVVVVPALSNPLGSCMPASERKRLAAMAAQHRVPVIEDVIYNDLVERDDLRKAVKAWDADGWVMTCGSFSKTLAPGLRLGWVDPGRWAEPLRRLKRVTSGAQTEVLERALADLLTQPGTELGLRQLRRLFNERLEAARAIIAASFPRGTRVTAPLGGFMLWLELPAAIDARVLYRACLAERICIAPGALFTATDRFQHCVRIGLGGPWTEAHRAALARVGALAQALLHDARHDSHGGRAGGPSTRHDPPVAPPLATA